VPGIQIEHDCQIEPVRARPDLADVGAPLPIWAVAGKTLVEKIGSDWTTVLAVGRLPIAPLFQGLQAIITQQPGHTMPPDIKSVFLELDMHAGSTMDFIRRGEVRTYVRQRDDILILSTTDGAALPGKVPALADAKNSAKAMQRKPASRWREKAVRR